MPLPWLLTCARHWGTRVRAASSRPVGFCGRLVPGGVFDFCAEGTQHRAGSRPARLFLTFAVQMALDLLRRRITGRP